MNRLAYTVHMSPEISQVTNILLNSEGTCTCGRVLRSLDPKFILINAAPSKEMMIVAAYCQPCSIRINARLKQLGKATYHHTTPTAPIEFNKKLL